MKNCTNLIQSFAKTLKIAFLFAMLFMLGVGQMWGYYYLPSDFEGGSWNNTSYQMSSGDDITFYAVNSTSGKSGDKYFFRLYMTGWGGQSSENLIASASGDALDSYGVSDDGAMWIVLNQIADVHFSVNTSNNKLTITANPSCYFIKYNWDGSGNWTYSGMMVSNLDGTYSVSGSYHGLSYNHARRGSDGGAGSDYHANGATIVGDTPADGDQCIFTLNPSNSYSLTIRKCNTVVQNGSPAGSNYIYFYNADANWTDTYLYFVIGRPEYSKMYRISQITNTKVWRAVIAYNADPSSEWYDAGYYAIAGGSTAWDNGTGWGPSSLTGWIDYSAPYLTPFNLRRNYYYFIEKENADDGGAITMTEKGMSMSVLNSITIGYKYSLHGTDMETGNTPAQVSMASYSFTTNNFTTGPNATQTISANTNDVYSKSLDNTAYGGAVGLTMSNLSDGYKFIGWYNGNTLEETGNTYTYYPNKNTTISAEYEYRWTLKGTFPNESEWTKDHFIEHVGVNASSQDTGYVELLLPGNASFQFKVIDRESGAWHSCSGTTDGSEYSFTYLSDKEKDCSAHTGSEKNMIFHTAAPGTYKFAWNADTKTLTVTYPTSYLVTYNGNGNTGGTAPTGVYYASNATVTVADEPDGWAKSAYTFGGWNTADDGSGSNYTAGSGQFTITDDTPLYAKWTQNVTLHDNNGAAHNGSTTATWNAAGPFSITAPQKKGYHVEGYYAEEGCTNKVMTDAGVLVNYSGYVESGKWVHAAATTLYTKWTANTYTVTLEKNGGTGSTPASVIATYDSDVLSASIPKPTKAGYYIAGWYTDDDKLVINADGSMASGLSGYTDSDGNWIHDGDVTLYAKWVLMWTIAGNRWSDWSKEDAYVLGNVGNKAGEDTCYVEIELDANTNYNFKLVKRGENSTYWWHALSASQTITYLSGKTTTTFTGQEGENYGYSCTLTSAGAGTYKFILNISAMTVTVNYPESYTVTFGYGTGGSEVTASGSISGSISSGGYVNKDEDITFTQSAATGYTFAGWYDESSGGSAISCMSSDNVYDDIAADIAVYAQYTPNPYNITLDKNGGAGQDVPASVTATYDSPTLTTLSNNNPWRNGYSFNGWYDGEGGTGNLIISTSKTLQPNTDYTDAEGNWTHDGDVTLYAKWTLRWAISGSWDSWDADGHLLGNVGRNASSQDTCSVNISLAANTTYAFKVVNWKLEYDGAYTWLALENQGNMSYKTDTVTAAFDTQATTTRDKSCTMRTAGAGTYKFAYNLSDKKVTVTYPTSYTVTFGSGTGGTVTGASGSVSGSITSGQYVAAGENVTFTPSPAVSSTLKGWYNASSGGSAISGMSSSDNVLDAIAANASVYAQWASSNFVIYRTGDMEDDPRLLEGDVETYAGGKIDKPIEYRMKVRELDKWYTLCLPFTVNAVKVWDDDDKEYYDIEPYYRGTVGGTLMGGHYIIRTPKQATDLPISEFGDWRDPESADGYLPSMNTPYIIQCHMSYFNGKYISFFGAADQTIPTSMTGGVAPIESNVVNVCVNNSMKSGDVTDPYMLDNDYGSGAWLRAKEKGTVRSINPFECYILANSETTERYLAIRRDMHNTDTPTGWDDVLNSERKEMINVYTLTGFRVAQYTNCSFNEANALLRAEHANGIYIMNAGNESVKLMIGGK